MRSSSARQAFFLLAVLMGSTMGCIGLVPAREIIEDLRDPAKMIEERDTINVDHTFTTIDPALYTYTEDFVVDQYVTEVTAFISAEFDGSDTIPILPPDTRFVEASLTDAAGNVVWNERLVTSLNKMVVSFEQPLELGTWTLYIEARGYGEELTNLIKDSFQVLIQINKECWQYPNEIGCSYEGSNQATVTCPLS